MISVVGIKNSVPSAPAPLTPVRLGRKERERMNVKERRKSARIVVCRDVRSLAGVDLEDGSKQSDTESPVLRPSRGMTGKYMPRLR